MKTWIYISGIIGGLLIIIGLSGIFKGLFLYTLILIAGLGMTCFVCFPLYWSEMKRQKKKEKSGIKTHGDDHYDSGGINGETSQAEGWSMNDSPFRERRSGLNWGGGNVHGANASRGTRRKFLK